MQTPTPVGRIDRTKHDVDVMEHVLGSARDPDADRTGDTEIVDLGIRPWLTGTMTSAVQLTIGLTRDADRRLTRRDV